MLQLISRELYLEQETLTCDKNQHRLSLYALLFVTYLANEKKIKKTVKKKKSENVQQIDIICKENIVISLTSHFMIKKLFHFNIRE